MLFGNKTIDRYRIFNTGIPMCPQQQPGRPGTSEVRIQNCQEETVVGDFAHRGFCTASPTTPITDRFQPRLTREAVWVWPDASVGRSSHGAVHSHNNSCA